MKKVTFIDLTSERRRARPRYSKEVVDLVLLKMGEEVVHDHRPYRTTMAHWVAQQRLRLGRPFLYQPLNGKDGRYLVWIASSRSRRALPRRRRVARGRKV